MKNKHYTSEEIIKISKLLSEGRARKEIAMILDRDYTRLTRKINELGLYKFKKIKSKTLKTTRIKKIEPKILKRTRSEKIEYYNNKVNLYFNNRIA